MMGRVLRAVRWAGGLCLLALPVGAAHAQATPTPATGGQAAPDAQWQAPTTSQPGTMVVKHATLPAVALINVVTSTMVKSMGPAAAAERLSGNSTTACPALATAPLKPLSGTMTGAQGGVVSPPGQHCAVVMRHDGGVMIAVFVFADPKVGATMTQQLAEGLMQGLQANLMNARQELVGEAATAAATAGSSLAHESPAKSAPQSAPPPPMTPAIAAALKGALDTIPADRKPMRIVNRWQYDARSGSSAYVYYLLFPNGYAVAPCDLWDLRKTPATPQALEAIKADCEAVPWRKTAKGYELFDGDEWLEAKVAQEVRSFTPGERLNIAVGTIGGSRQKIGFGQDFNGTVNVFEGGLRLTPDGLIFNDMVSQTWHHNAINVGGMTYLNGQDVSGARQDYGYYRVDGYLAALMNTKGEIRFVSLVRTGTDAEPYIFLNGEMYWNRDGD